MKILLIRHAQAVDEAPGLGDAGRWLTPKGRAAARKLARWLRRNDKRRPVVIWTSPLLRAAQTAEILAAGVRHEGEVRACAELSPGRDTGDLIERLTALTSAGVVALVGHEDSLALLGTALLGDGSAGELRKCGVIGLEWENGAGRAWFRHNPGRKKAAKPQATAAGAADPASDD